MTDLPPAPTVRQAKWDQTLRLIDYLNRKWAHAMGHGQGEITLKFPTPLVNTITDALQYMIDHRMPLYRVQAAVGEDLMDMAANASEAVGRMSMAVSELEALVERRRPKGWVAPVRPPSNGYLSFGG